MKYVFFGLCVVLMVVFLVVGGVKLVGVEMMV